MARHSFASGTSVAIIGAGPAGLVTARYLNAYGFTPVIFEKGDRIGGQWSGNRACSGIWPSMHTNTSRITTRFSDLDYEAGTPVYPSNIQVSQYVHRYAAKFGLMDFVRLATPVLNVEMKDGGYQVLYRDAEGNEHVEMFSRIVAAPGRHTKPFIPEIKGLSGFTGEGGARHSMTYNGVDDYRAMRVLVAGCSFSALEIASELAANGVRVTTTNRRQRYVFPKLLRGSPLEHLAFTRFAALTEEYFLPEIIEEKLNEFVIEAGANPLPYGGLKPAARVSEAGTTVSQHYLPFIAEGRISSKPWIDRIEGHTVRFADGTQDVFDAILFGTGYQLNLPFLSESIRTLLDIDEQHIDLYKHTFHPHLPGLAFAGILNLAGPYFPVLELQARWIAYTWSGVLPEPSRADMEAAIGARRGKMTYLPFHTTALLFSRLAGVEPDPTEYPELTRALYFGPLSPESFRLTGPDALADAASRIKVAAAAFGTVPCSTLTSTQLGHLAALANVSRNVELSSMIMDQLSGVMGLSV